MFFCLDNGEYLTRTQTDQVTPEPISPASSAPSTTAPQFPATERVESNARITKCRLEQLPAGVFLDKNVQSLDMAGKAENLKKKLLDAYGHINNLKPDSQTFPWSLKQRLLGPISYECGIINFNDASLIKEKAKNILNDMLKKSYCEKNITEDSENYKHALALIQMRLIMDMTAALEVSDKDKLQEEQFDAQKKRLVEQAQFVGLEASFQEFDQPKTKESKDKETPKNTINIGNGIVVKKDQQGNLFCEAKSLTNESILEMIHTLKLSGATTITWHGVKTTHERYIIEQLCAKHGVTAKYADGPKPSDLAQFKPEDSNNLTNWLEKIATLDNKPEWLSDKSMAMDNFMVGIVSNARLGELLDNVHGVTGNDEAKKQETYRKLICEYLTKVDYFKNNLRHQNYLINNIAEFTKEQQQEVWELSKTDTRKQNNLVRRICEASGGAVFIHHILQHIKVKNDDIKLFVKNIGTNSGALTNLWQAVDKLSSGAEKQGALTKLYEHMNDQQRKEFVSEASKVAAGQQAQAPTQNPQGQSSSPPSSAAAAPALTGQSAQPAAAQSQAPTAVAPTAPQPQSAQSRFQLLKKALEDKGDTKLLDFFNKNLTPDQRQPLNPPANVAPAPTPGQNP